MFRAVAVGLLVIVSTAASLASVDVHGATLAMVIACAALAAGAGVAANSVKKNAFKVTERTGGSC